MLLVALAIIFAVASAWAIWWVTNLAPLERGSVVFGTGSIRFEAPLEAPDVALTAVSAFGVDGHVLTVPADRGTIFTYDLTVRNDGPVDVEILDVGSGEPGDPLVRRLVAADPDLFDDGVPGKSFAPFEPFTIPPDGQAALRIRVTVDQNLQPGTTVSWYTEEATFRVFKTVERRMTLNTRMQVDLVGDQR